MSILSRLPRACAEVTQTVVDHFIARPLHGLGEITSGILDAVPHLAHATWEAAITAVRSRLSAAARLDVQRGLDRITAGVKLLAAPVALAVVVWGLRHRGLVCVGWLASLVVILALAAG